MKRDLSAIGQIRYVSSNSSRNAWSFLVASEQVSGDYVDRVFNGDKTLTRCT